jgi:4-hydroxybenzoate polyprenyltransferase
MLTFLYSAPKLPYAPFAWLKKVAIGKTLFLSFVWTYVTTVSPIIISGQDWQPAFTLFILSRFFLIYPICILFDYRDREDDKRDGIRSLITIFPEKGINALFYGSLIAFLLVNAGLYFTGYPLLTIVFLCVPGFILLTLYNTAKRNFSDYLYYFVLDGLMMFSAGFTFLL